MNISNIPKNGLIKITVRDLFWSVKIGGIEAGSHCFLIMIPTDIFKNCVPELDHTCKDSYH